MNSINTDEIKKVDAWFDIIGERIITPIRETDIKKSCTATLALLFAAIDGLGKLSCRDMDYGRAERRFKSFLRRMGEDYEQKADALWYIRCGIVHNGVNLESYMFATYESDFQLKHLSTRGPGGFLYIDITKLFCDFCEANRQLREEMRRNDLLLRRAANRLEWLEVETTEYAEDEMPRPTPPPAVEFIHLTQG